MNNWYFDALKYANRLATNSGCRSIGVSNPTKPSLSELVGLINNEEFYGAVTLKTLYAEKEYMDYVLKRGY